MNILKKIVGVMILISSAIFGVFTLIFTPSHIYYCYVDSSSCMESFRAITIQFLLVSFGFLAIILLFNKREQSNIMINKVPVIFTYIFIALGIAAAIFMYLSLFLIGGGFL